MTDEHLEPLDPEFGKLLDAERAAGADAAAIDRVWSRVALGAGVTAPTSSGGTPGNSGWLASNAFAVAAATFLVGGLVGAGVHAVLQKPAAERIVYVEAPPASAAPVPIVPPAPSVPLAPVATAAPPTPRAAVHPPAAPMPSSLAAERALLDDARGALGAGDAAKALALADDHGRRFPRAQLGEEREAIAIQALVALGRSDEARARAARFRAAAPNSLFTPVIEASLSSIP